jgi:hypothetical protein
MVRDASLLYLPSRIGLLGTPDAHSNSTAVSDTTLDLELAAA